jgi:GMP synthase (glutamine-hydrolysing)
MKVLVVAHQERARFGVLAEAVAAKGDELDRWDIYADAKSRPAFDDYAAVVLLGGNMHVDDDTASPWLPVERALVRRCLAAGRPILGLCFGAQLLAHVTGGVVRRAEVPELGWHEVRLTDDAAADDLFATGPARMRAFQWHVDEFSVPARHVTLARSARCDQAFRVGRAAWGLQFHPEFPPETISEFIERQRASKQVRLQENDLDRIRHEMLRHSDAWKRVGRDLLARFLDIAQARALARG